MIYYFTPFSSEKRLGHIHNQYCALVPNDDDFICLMDPDTMFLLPDTQEWIEMVISEYGQGWDLLGCTANRVGIDQQVKSMECFTATDINFHIRQAAYSICDMRHIEETDIIAGFFMLFKKSLWNKIKFEESIQFDMKFCNAIKAAGGRIGIMKGIYIFHSYRLGKNIKDKSHLIK